MADRLAQAEDEDFRAEQGELGEEEYTAKRAKADKQAKPRPDFICLKTAGTFGAEPDSK